MSGDAEITERMVQTIEAAADATLRMIADLWNYMGDKTKLARLDEVQS